MSMSKSKDYADKVRGALYGFAIGDAMGATTECMDKESIRREYGIVDDIIGGGWLYLKPGQVTDDTQMMICVMEALQDSIEIGSGINTFYKLVGANFVEWLRMCPKDVGGQCAKGINFYIRHGEQMVARKEALGNGGLMRALPCALVGKIRLNLIQNDFTHGNPMCRYYIAMYHSVVCGCIVGNNWMYTIDTKDGAILQKPTGCVINTFNNVLYHVMHTRDFRGAVISSVNDGGDADTIGALVGSIAGAIYGYNNIPLSWIEKLDPKVKKYLEKFVNFCCQEV